MTWQERRQWLAVLNGIYNALMVGYPRPDAPEMDAVIRHVHGAMLKLQELPLPQAQRDEEGA